MIFKKPIFLLIIVMATIVIVVGALTLFTLYNTAVEKQTDQLKAMVRSQATLIAAVAEFDSLYSQDAYSDGAKAATLSQVQKAYKNFKGFGKSGELVIATLDGNNIKFLSRTRFNNSAKKNELPTIMGGVNAAVMQQALSQKAGSIIAKDYRGKLVLAAYEYVKSLKYGVVVKIDVDEVRAPFIWVGVLSITSAIILIVLGAIFFHKITSSLLKRLQESDDYNRMLFESSPIGLALSTMDGRLVDINSAYAKIIGRSIEETKKLTYWDITPEEYGNDEAKQLDKLNTTGRYGPYEKEYIHKDVHRVPVSLLGQVIERNGEKYIWSSVEDISNRKETERVFHLNEARLNEAQRLAKVGSWELDLLSGELIWSDEIFNIFEIDKEKFPASYDAFLEAIHPDDRDKVNAAYTNSLETQQAYEVVHRLKMNDGTIKHVRETCESYFSDEYKPLRSVGTVQDITEIFNVQVELEKHRLNLEELIIERTKELNDTQDVLVRKERLATLGQLTATVSHELRNPLAAMRPSLYVIQKLSDKENERSQKAIDRINRNIERCDHIIDELLDFTRITDLDLKTTSVDVWLDSVIEEQVVPEGISLKKEYGLSKLKLDIDSNRLRRAIINVFDNGCHAMMDDGKNIIDAKSPQLEVKTRMNNDYAEIIISDTGKGIAKDVLDKIYEPLFSTKGFGVGLGMSVVKQIIEQHKGYVEIETKENKGTSVVLKLPIN